MGDPALELEIRADLTQLRAQLSEATVSLKQLAAGIETPGGLAPAFGRTAKEAEGFYGKLRELKGEAVQHQRVFGFFGAQLAQTGLIARETGAAFVGLGTALASGMWILAAVEAAKLLAGVLTETGQAGAEALKELQKQADEAARSLQRVVDKMRGISPEQRVLLDLQAQQGKLQVDHNTALAKEGTLIGELIIGLKTVVFLDETRSDQLKKQLDLIDKALADQQKNVALQKFLAADEAGGKAREERERRAAAALKKEADDWRAFQDMLTASGIKEAEEETRAEAKIREDARKQEQADILAWQKEIEAIEGPEAQRKGERAMQDYEDKRKVEALEEQRKETQKLAMAGSLAAEAFGSIGQAIGGQAGKMAALFGKLITQAVQLAIAMSAELPPPLGTLNMIASAAAILATIAAVPKYETGTPYVPRTGLALVHEGEQIIPARENAGGFSGGLHVTINASALDQAWWHQHQGEILRTLSAAARNRRTS